MKKMIFIPVVLLSLAAISEHWPTGYYRTVSDPTNSFYYNDESRWFCHIQNATQANLYQVESQIRVVGDVASFLNQATSLNECAWPNGFYKIAGNEGPVFRLYPGNICTITSPEMLAAYGGSSSVIEAEAGSDFGSHRTQIGQCFWPSYDMSSDADVSQR
jgi:hypothetical protein